MPSYLEKKRREAQDPNYKSIFDEVVYGSVIGILDRDSRSRMMDIRRLMFEAGIRKTLTPFAMEALFVRDPRNKVEEKYIFPKRPIKAGLDHIVSLSGEEGSRIRHKLPRMCIALRGNVIIRRYKAILDLGFRNLHRKHGPVLTLKEHPTEEDLEIAQEVLRGLPVSERIIRFEREVWGRWR